MLPDSFNVLSDMYYFAKVAEYGSYSLAERALGVPKSRIDQLHKSDDARKLATLLQELLAKD